MRRPPASEAAAVRALCADLRLGPVAPALLHLGHHSLFRLAPLPVVARVQSGEPLPLALATAARELAVARHLAVRGAPALAPHPALAGPHVADGMAVTLWPWLADTRPADDRDADLAARTLARLHAALRDLPAALPPHGAELDRCRALLDGPAPLALAPGDRELLRSELHRLRAAAEAVAAPVQPLHGDAHPGNLLVGAGEARWIDFEATCIGPREADIATLPAAAWSGFPAANQGLVSLHARLKSVRVAAWCAVEPGRHPALAEAAVHHLAEVRAYAP